MVPRDPQRRGGSAGDGEEEEEQTTDTATEEDAEEEDDDDEGEQETEGSTAGNTSVGTVNNDRAVLGAMAAVVLVVWGMA